MPRPHINGSIKEELQSPRFLVDLVSKAIGFIALIIAALLWVGAEDRAVEARIADRFATLEGLAREAEMRETCDDNIATAVERMEGTVKEIDVKLDRVMIELGVAPP